MRSFIYTFFLLILPFLLFSACTPEEVGDVTAPKLLSSVPADKAVDVNVSTSVSLFFNEKILLAANAQIKLNNQTVEATSDARTLTISTTLAPSTDYTLTIPDKALSDVAGNFVKTFSITFRTSNTVTAEGTILEAENATLSNGAAIASTIAGYSGAGYVNMNNGNITFNVNATENGYYRVFARYSSGGDKTQDFHVDGQMMAGIHFAQSAQWKETEIATVRLNAGTHSISIIKNWGYISLDYLKIAYVGNTTSPFNIAANLVTPQPSTQAVKVYNFLKENFGKKVISGVIADSTRNTDEPKWVFEKTGKWPALVGYDFMDHTWLNQNWIKYDGPFMQGKRHWENNGLVTLTWHWRDPLTKSGAFYTADTNFDVSKVNDVNSNEYKAIIVDIDTIATYLKEFRNAGIPVIWRPLHEAAGGWFWWGAKGPQPCKALWRLLFDRLVNHHGLNNLIWVWTTDVSASAADWYPGDEYVDVLGMDIYPGENQHGSQYISFNKVKEIFGGRKLITLSECGSVPDPAMMLEYGDMWSWFMVWSGDYTRSDSHNGATWWQKFFSYDYVITRDKMPDLK
ncbi:MAG: Ig-like domain-containing protein [Paludibacteraceae bacterium]|nr:Ig-like domain-containing protein [Paludibacteraceae bacterium]